MYFSDPMFGGKDWKLDQGRPEFLTSFEICPWFFDQDGEGEWTTGLSRAPLPPPPVKSALVQLLQQNQNLKTLTLFGTVNLHQYEKSDANGCIVDPSIVNSWLEALPESLEALSMDTPWSNPENQRVGERERPTFSVPVLRKVHTLNLVSARCPYFRQYDEPTNFYAELIRACPNLETLRLPVYNSPATRDSTTGFTWDWEAQDYARIFQESCPKLTALCIDGQTSDDHFAQLLGSGSRLGWKSIKIGDRFYPGPARESSVNIDFGPLSTEALLKHAGTLLNVRLHNCSKVPSAAIQQLLCTAFQLRSFHSVSTGSTLQEATLDARDMTGSEWVCEGLESFACRITHIPRPDLGLKWAVESYSWDLYNRYHGPSFKASYLESLSSGGTCTSEESWSLQRRVYNQLARLVRLRELILETKRYTIPYQDDLIPGPTVVQSDNWMDFESWIEIQNCFQPDGLSMTLASGMGVLKELKALKLIGLPYGLDREEEQAWRKEHWPKAIDASAYKRLEDSCWASMFDPPKEWGTL
ncbi:hypothetical protein BGZ97_004588 [Linnemannia gamsii]|uniref:Uncharacterized protein n=1 Tax=Linnemannia gamsii TaxID=64522 RepID=A0A9P6RDE2_9FUNG|nr:hypothetical protein BGZ97_004588 [Linnemannia gamsii]